MKKVIKLLEQFRKDIDEINDIIPKNYISRKPSFSEVEYVEKGQYKIMEKLMTKKINIYHDFVMNLLKIIKKLEKKK